jgi:hypothetical protein
MKENYVLPKLPQSYVDYSAYHNKLGQSCPNSSSRKKYMEGWLLKHNIQFLSDLLMTDLYGIMNHRISMQKRDFLGDVVSQLRCLPSTITVLSPLKMYREMSSSASDTKMSRSSWMDVRRHVANIEQQLIGTEVLTEPEA